MTQPPHIDGLPLWAQITISLLFGLAALGAAYKGYFTKEKADPAKPSAAHTAFVAEIGATQRLNDTIVRLDAALVGLCRHIEDANHYERQSIEAARELCGRLRHLAEMMERQLED